MTEPVRYELIDPEELPIEKVGRLTNLLTYGIVNPMGPTLNVVAFDGELALNARSYVVHVVLNPFTCEATRIAIAHVGESSDLGTDLPDLFGSLQQQSSCPTLLLSSLLIEPWQIEELWARFLAGFPNSSRTLHLVQQFPGDPWNRVQHEIDTTDPKQPPSPDNWLTAAEARAFARTQLDPPNVHAELQAFLFGWRGAVEFQQLGMAAVAAAAMPLDSLLRWMTRLAASVELPQLTDPGR